MTDWCKKSTATKKEVYKLQSSQNTYRTRVWIFLCHSEYLQGRLSRWLLKYRVNRRQNQFVDEAIENTMRSTSPLCVYSTSLTSPEVLPTGVTVGSYRHFERTRPGGEKISTLDWISWQCGQDGESYPRDKQAPRCVQYSGLGFSAVAPDCGRWHPGKPATFPTRTAKPCKCHNCQTGININFTVVAENTQLNVFITCQ